MRTITRLDPPRRPVGGDHLDALRRAIAHLGDGYATFRGGLSRARRRAWIRQVLERHRAAVASPGRT